MRNSWRQVSLGDLLEVKHGFAFQGDFFRDDPSGDILVTPGNFAIGGGFKAEKFKYYVGPVPEDYVLREDDLIVTMTDLSKDGDTLGYPALVPSVVGPRYLHNQRIGKVLLRDPAIADKRFLFYVLCTDDYRHEILASATGSTVKHTAPARIQRFRFDLPSLDEQRSIARVLGSIDDKIEHNRRLNRSLEDFVTALFHSWFVDFDPVVANAAARLPGGLTKKIAALFPAAFTDSKNGAIPEGWLLSTIDGAVSKIIDHRGKTPTKLGGAWADEGVPTVSAKNIKGGRLVNRSAVGFIDEGLYRAWMPDELQPGDVLMTSEAPLGELLFLPDRIKWCLSQRLFGLRAKDGVCKPSYLYCWLSSPDCQAELSARESGTTVMGIRQAELRTVPVLLPPLRLQGEFEKIVYPMLRGVWQNEQECEALAALRQALLPQLLSGELRIQDAEKQAAVAV